MGQCLGREEPRRSRPDHRDYPLSSRRGGSANDCYGSLPQRSPHFSALRFEYGSLTPERPSKLSSPASDSSPQKAEVSSGPRVKQKELADHKKNDDPQVKVDPNTAGTKPEEPCSLFEPEVEIKSGKVSYRFKCPGSGLYQCSLTGLVFNMSQEAELLYRIIQWDQSILQPAGKTPAGPLFDIKGCEDALRQLHFPHCETEEALLSDGLLSVIHFSDDEMSILEVLKITDTHVIVEVPHLSAFGLVWDFIKRFWKSKNPVKGQVLLFLRTIELPETQKQNLDVFLLPNNIPLQEVKAQHPYSDYIPVPSDCKLIKDQTYTVHCPTAKKIQPKKAEFNVDFGPNYYATFEIRLAVNTNEATVTVQDQTGCEVWEHDVDLMAVHHSPIVASISLQDLQQHNHSLERTSSVTTAVHHSPVVASVNLQALWQHNYSLERTSSVTTAPPERNVPPKQEVLNSLLDILNDLNDGDFKTFKWHLKSESWNDIEPIKVNHLSNTERYETVDLMIQNYKTSGAVRVMENVLKKINRNDLVDNVRVLAIKAGLDIGDDKQI